MQQIRNFSIIAHIDHGKSTLADRFLEATGTIEKRKMREQVLDSMDLERERGITIKMQPARMEYTDSVGRTYIVNLIDTPGHIDFAYEVSRALTAVEGVLLLVDATQGVQAQTLSVLEMAKHAGCLIIPVVSKIDATLARVPETVDELAHLLSIPTDTVLKVSGKTGEGVTELLDAIVRRVPAPATVYAGAGGRALVFDFSYSEHRGVTMYLRVMDGIIRAKDAATLAAVGKKLNIVETGWFKPGQVPCEKLEAGEIGYIVSGIKEPGIALVGDTLISGNAALAALPGYQTPRPVVWAGMYPDSQDGFTFLKQALARLRLSDAALSYEEEGSSILGKGFRCGFLGMLHMEIVTERLKREFGIEPVITMPSIAYDIVRKGRERETVYSASQFPDDGSLEQVYERWVMITVITPPEHLSSVTQLLYEHEAVTEAVDTFGDGRMSLSAAMPLRELMRGFFDRLKSASSGFASLSYEFGDMRKADVTRLDVLVAEEIVPAFSRIVSRRRVDEEARALVERLHAALPKQLFVVKIQAKADGRIIASRTLSAMRKDVTGYLYGGDITRKKKLLEKQKKGKERRGEHARMHIPPDVFLKLVKPSED
jgi:GTP-binding protein LepA